MRPLSLLFCGSLAHHTLDTAVQKYSLWPVCFLCGAVWKWDCTDTNMRNSGRFVVFRKASEFEWSQWKSDDCLVLYFSGCLYSALALGQFCFTEFCTVPSKLNNLLMKIAMMKTDHGFKLKWKYNKLYFMCHKIQCTYMCFTCYWS